MEFKFPVFIAATDRGEHLPDDTVQDIRALVRREGGRVIWIDDPAVTTWGELEKYEVNVMDYVLDIYDGRFFPQLAQIVEESEQEYRRYMQRVKLEEGPYFDPEYDYGLEM